MTSEYLLDAVGLIDDDLIAEAEEPVRAPAPVPWLRRWGGSVAACLVVAALGWTLFDAAHTGMGGGMSGGASYSSDGASSAGTAAGSALPGEPAGGMAPSGEGASSHEPSSPEPGSGGFSGAGSSMEEAPGDTLGSGGAQAPVSGTVFVENASGGSSTYRLTRYVERLPEGAFRIGELCEAPSGAAGPSVDRAEYAGLNLWQSEDGTRVYVELSGDSFVEAELVQP